MVVFPYPRSCHETRIRWGGVAILKTFVLVYSLTSSAMGAQVLPKPGPDFSLVIFPDTQNYMSASNREVWFSQCRWVADHRIANNIEAVLSTGDISDRAREKEFSLAAEGYDLVENAGITVFPLAGNCDYKRKGGYDGRREAPGYEDFVASRRLARLPGFGGTFDGSYANYYCRLDVGGMKFLILALEFFPRAVAVDWAAGVIDANPDRKVIVLTHAYLNADGKRTSPWDLGGPRFYGYFNADRGMDGEELWKRLISKKPTILAVICGHQHPGHFAHRADAGVNGNIVNQFFLNYQGAPRGGEGWIGILSFHPSNGTMDFGAYRTWAPAGLGFAPGMETSR